MKLHDLAFALRCVFSAMWLVGAAKFFINIDTSKAVIAWLFVSTGLYFMPFKADR